MTRAGPHDARSPTRPARPGPGVRVSWSTSDTDGRVAPRSPVTDSAGVAAAQWTLAATADTQTARVTVEGFPLVELHAVVPVATVTAEPRHTAWTGDVVRLDAAGRDAA